MFCIILMYYIFLSFFDLQGQPKPFSAYRLKREPLIWQPQVNIWLIFDDINFTLHVPEI